MATLRKFNTHSTDASYSSVNVSSGSSGMHSSSVCQKYHCGSYYKQKIVGSHSKFLGRTYINCLRFPNGYYKFFLWLHDRDRDYNLGAQVSRLFDQLQEVCQELLDTT